MNNRRNFWLSWSGVLFSVLLVFSAGTLSAKAFSDNTFLIAGLNKSNFKSQRLWNYLRAERNSGIEVGVTEQNGQVSVAGAQENLDLLFGRLTMLIQSDDSRILPVFLNVEGDPMVLDSLIRRSAVAPAVFFLPRGEAWPPIESLVHSDRRIIFFISGDRAYSGQVFHRVKDYIFRVSAAPGGVYKKDRINLELFLIDDFEQLPTGRPSGRNIGNLVPDYINFLLENWTKFGKRPNFIFVGENIYHFDFILDQLNSFIWVNGTIRDGERILGKVFWRNPEVQMTGGHFSFPYRGGDELTLTPFVAGYRLTPEQVIVTGEMEVPENYHIMAKPLKLGQGMTGYFRFDGSVRNLLSPAEGFKGADFSFSRDIERGTVLRLPEGASVNLGPPGLYGFRNSSFTVSCFVKFNEILEAGDNAVLGNYENEFRRGLHLILRSGHPYFGLWANDFVSREQLESNVWYHLVWRYIIETGEQAIFLNGKNIGSSAGHLPFSGTGDIHLGSALSRGASLRGYIDDLFIWNRPLGAEEINRLSLDEEVIPTTGSLSYSFFQRNRTILFLVAVVFLAGGLFLWFFLRKKSPRKRKQEASIPGRNDANQVNLFGGFSAIDNAGVDVSSLFTPKVREFFLFVLFGTVEDGSGKNISQINASLWPGLSVKKVTNNRGVTLNKLRKILERIDGVDVASRNGALVVTMEPPFFCDYVEAYKLCQVPGGMDKQQLENFFLLVKKGRFLDGEHWSWLDQLRGYTGNQVIDNLLKLASLYKKENKFQLVEALAKRILEYDELNEEAIYLQVWTLQKSNNLYQAKFLFNSFCSKYSESLGEPYPHSFSEFTRKFSAHL